LGSKSRYQRKARTPLAVRSFGLKRAFPLSEYRLKNDKLFWKGTLQPTALSTPFEVVITCKQYASPEIWVYVGEVQDIESIPHKYETDKTNNRVRICLCLPSEYETEWGFLTAIIPWTIEWLYFYEIWLATGEWRGGGCHPKTTIPDSEM
jgi:hypothetical protein